MRLKFVFWLDAFLFLLFCALETVPFTGLTLHEWLGLAVIALVVLHMLLSWSWIASSTRALFRSGDLRTRVNYLVNLLLFASVTGVIFSGIRISQQAIPAMLGPRTLDPMANYGWDRLHDQLSDLVVILAGLHLAINWSWTLAAARKLFGARVAERS